jgi:hypothetical protein
VRYKGFYGAIGVEKIKYITAIKTILMPDEKAC